MSVERPVCAERDTKIAALDLLAVAARKSPQAMSTLLENVRTGERRESVVDG